MQFVERTCCIISAHSSDTGKRLSCSGVIVNRTGLVICSGSLFRSLWESGTLSTNKDFLFPPSNTNRTLEVLVEQYEPVGVNECSAGTSPRPLSALHAELVMLVNCQEFRTAFRNLFNETDKWSLSEDDENDPDSLDVLSWFAVLKVWNRVDCVPYAKTDSLKKGWPLIACGSPFGSLCPDLFMSTLSKGIVSNLYGKDNVVVLTDARCLPGTEGGGIFVKDVEQFYLVGVIVSPLCWKSNDWIGLSLACSVHVIMSNIQNLAKNHQTLHKHLGDVWKIADGAPITTVGLSAHPVVALVESGKLWGSGILYKHRLVLTCRHVVDGKSAVIVKFYRSGRFHSCVGDVVFSTKSSSPYDIAVLCLRKSPPEEVDAKTTSFFRPGEDVVVIGYGAFGGNCGPSMTSGILSRVVGHRSQPVMLQTTCAVQAGASGGAVLRPDTGELLGLVSSNTRDFRAEVTYPHLNFSIPVTVLEPLLQSFLVSGDPKVFQELNRAGVEVSNVWRLQNPPSKL